MHFERGLLLRAVWPKNYSTISANSRRYLLTSSIIYDQKKGSDGKKTSSINEKLEAKKTIAKEKIQKLKDMPKPDTYPQKQILKKDKKMVGALDISRPPVSEQVHCIEHTPPANALKAAFWTEFAIFFVFGFFDNFIMMSVGDQVDRVLGSLIPHAMLAAGCGNWLSDLFGLISGERVENYLNDRFPAPPLTSEQMNHKSYHNSKHYGRWAGMSAGCLVGAIAALPFLSFEKDDDNNSSSNSKEPNSNEPESKTCSSKTCSAKTNYTNKIEPKFCSTCGQAFSAEKDQSQNNAKNVVVKTVVWLGWGKPTREQRTGR